MKKIIVMLCCIIATNIGFSQRTTLVLSDPDRNAPTNVRAEPGGEVIATIDGRNNDIEVHVISKKGNYFLVESYMGCDGKLITLRRPGYIHNSVLGTFISNYGRKPFPIYGSSSKGVPLKSINLSDQYINVLDYANNMYFVYSKTLDLKFWVEEKYICWSNCTTCS
jgi:hypothetical protein